MSLVLDLGILLLVIVGIAIYIASRSEKDWPLIFSVLIAVSALWISRFIGDGRPSLLITVSSAIGITALLYDRIVLGRENPADKYFGFLQIGLWLAIILMVIHVLRFDATCEDVWLLPLAFVGVATWICKKREGLGHKRVFLWTGTMSFLLFLIALVLYPLVGAGKIDPNTLNQSIRLNAGMFVFLAMFFLGNYAKLGYLSDFAIHKKVFLVFVVLYSLPIFARYPQLSPFLETIPFGDKLLIGAIIGSIGFAPTIGVVLRRQLKNKEADPSVTSS